MRRQPTALPAPLLGLVAAAALLSPQLAAASEEGLEIYPDPTRLLVLLVLFVTLVPVLNRLLFKPLLGVLDARAERIEGARAHAAELAQQAAALLARHDEAVRQARETAHGEQVRLVEEARHAHQATVGAARSAAEREVGGARGEISRAAASARGALGAEAEPLAREITARLLGRSAA
ncbi:MAG: synthase [Deltaproteobacteria bacterium]|nr:synthase [Deltaproteobacteria bacterium]